MIKYNQELHDKWRKYAYISEMWGDVLRVQPEVMDCLLRELEVNQTLCDKLYLLLADNPETKRLADKIIDEERIK